MKAKRKLILVPFLSLVLPAGLQAADGLEPAASIDLPSVKGRIDHFGVDLKQQRLFVAALGNDTLEVVDVPPARHVAVVDRAKRAVVATWGVPGAESNYPMALDESGRRLFVGARKPAVLLVYDIDSGKVVAKQPIGEDTDDIFFDPQRKRLYVICGQGRIDIVRQENPDRYSLEGTVRTAPRARTGLFVPEEGRLYVAAPAIGTSPARLIAYRLR